MGMILYKVLATLAIGSFLGRKELKQILREVKEYREEE